MTRDFFAFEGDDRNFEHSGLNAIHTAFVLLHNEFEEDLRRANRRLTGEQLFQVFNNIESLTLRRMLIFREHKFVQILARSTSRAGCVGKHCLHRISPRSCGSWEICVVRSSSGCKHVRSDDESWSGHRVFFCSLQTWSHHDSWRASVFVVGFWTDEKVSTENSKTRPHSSFKRVE